jgi:hypothetical protein
VYRSCPPPYEVRGDLKPAARWYPRQVMLGSDLTSLAELHQSAHSVDRDFQWVPDDASEYCLKCDAAFTITLRRHHCRVCGTLACRNCVVTLTTGKGQKTFGPKRIRVCKGEQGAPCAGLPRSRPSW